MKKSVHYILMIFAASFFVGCNYSVTKEAPSDQNTNVILSAQDLSYAKINEQIIKPKCLQCHSGRDEPNLTTYQSLVDHSADIIRESIDSSKMPKNNRKLTAIERQNLKAWFDAGVPQFGKTPEPLPSNPATEPAPMYSFDRPVLWETVKTQILDKSCNSCHFAGNKEGLSSYEDYAQTKATIGTIFYTVSINPVMPPGPEDLEEGAENPNQLSRRDKDLLSAWITDGMKK